MDVVKPNITREPLQDLGEFVERASVHAGFEELPILMPLPISRLEIVLNIEQPHTRATSHKQNGDLYKEIPLPANVIDRPADECEQGNIRPDHAVLLAFAGIFFPETMPEGKDDQRTNGKKDERITHHTIADFFVPGRGEIFIHSHGVDIANAAAV